MSSIEQESAQQPPAPARRQRSARLMFTSTVLVTEVVLLLFVGLTAYGLRMAEPGQIVLAAGVGAAVCLLCAALVRTRVGLVLGSVVQLGLVGLGVVLPMMWLLGGVFAATWVVAVVLGAKIDRERAQREARATP